MTVPQTGGGIDLARYEPSTGHMVDDGETKKMWKQVLKIENHVFHIVHFFGTFSILQVFEIKIILT